MTQNLPKICLLFLSLSHTLTDKASRGLLVSAHKEFAALDVGYGYLDLMAIRPSVVFPGSNPLAS